MNQDAPRSSKNLEMAAYATAKIVKLSVGILHNIDLEHLRIWKEIM